MPERERSASAKARPKPASFGAAMRQIRSCVALLALAIGCSESPPRGLVLVTVDTLRADALGTYGAPGDLTPELDRLAQQSLVFTSAYAPAPFTYPSIAAVLTGRHPGALGIQTNLSRIPPEVLRSGDHGAVARWRAERAGEITRARRPDLLGKAAQRNRKEAD